MTPLELAQEYLFAHDLRAASERIYLAAIKALNKQFGASAEVSAIDHRSILTWRRKVLENGLSKRSWNTYSNHLRTIWGYAIEHGLLTHTTVNPFKKTTVIPPKRASKIVASSAIQQARNWLISQVGQERCTDERAQITPAWFWLATFEMFYYTGIRLNALLCLRLQDVDWDNQLILVRGDTEKTHREFFVPIMEGLGPHVWRILTEAKNIGFAADDQLFNVNRFSRHYQRREMNIDQVEAMYRKLHTKTGVRMTPHRFRHTLATDLMKQPERNIHLTKSLLNHSNIATTMGYIEADYDHMRAVLHERSLVQGALSHMRRVDDSGAPPNSTNAAEPSPCAPARYHHDPQLGETWGMSPSSSAHGAIGSLRGSAPSDDPPSTPQAPFEPSLLFALMASRSVQPTFVSRSSVSPGSTLSLSARSSP